ncbi:MaoC family dehydratase [Vallicoccus soli]|uniref:Dehydratase n=1 Tax=Vallicoccus soli TaxID=2339232 RepID=A0A3A3YUF5_9ACTN|nr:MaoC family dehydratase [Vallicoccus soli]RJK93432.1 dehydratase [Vallicoccus soli]
MSRPAVGQVAVGDALPPLSVHLSRADLVQYAGASGDLNPIHWDEHFARSVGLPDVIAHGMLTMGLAVRAVTSWAGDPGAVVDYRTRFTRPVAVAHDGGADVEVTGVVAQVHDDGTVRVDLTVTSAGAKVLGAARAVVRLAPAPSAEGGVQGSPGGVA